MRIGLNLRSNWASGIPATRPSAPNGGAMLRRGDINDHTARKLFTEITFSEALPKPRAARLAPARLGLTQTGQQISRRKRGGPKTTVLMRGDLADLRPQGKASHV
ncbi:hypothetical protein [Mesorhizobium sp. B2-6-2]|uniref:hypothetical protein n=1 Tax=Mesorhizobium sp. B2-6-2 TaxID=2589915 RepID=UPI00112B1921|nr:hypothetical protein [Mesorhizobium sp. B2-6-2]TPJ75617.1 hypothetical protein FJ419_20805 [Mesorhizobium sp. B2-6-2]